MPLRAYDLGGIDTDSTKGWYKLLPTSFKKGFSQSDKGSERWEISDSYSTMLTAVLTSSGQKCEVRF